jgi:hypothetical protein
MSELMESTGYLQIRSVLEPSGNTRNLSPIDYHGVRVREFRQYFCLGHCVRRDHSLVVWMHSHGQNVEVQLSGPLLPYFMALDRAVSMGVIIKSVSMGGSTLNI